MQDKKKWIKSVRPVKLLFLVSMEKALLTEKVHGLVCIRQLLVTANQTPPTLFGGIGNMERAGFKCIGVQWIMSLLNL